MKNTIFTGAAVAIITPMNEDGTINYDVFGQIIDYQVENGSDAIVVCGTTGESATLSHEDHVEAIAFCVKRVNHRIPVIAGTGSNDTAYAKKLSLAAQEVGVDALLMVTPYYNKTSQQGLIKHYLTVADCVSLPIILYNVPTRTGCNITPETCAILAKHKNIVAIKEASGNISQVAKIAALCGDEIDIYSGNDDQIVPIMSLGGKGVISVLSNVAPKVAHDIVAKYLEGDVAGSLSLQLEYLDLCNDLFIDVNPIPVKEAVGMMGFNVGPCRLPLVGLSEADHAKLYNTMKKHGIVD